MSNWLATPFVVPVAGCIMILGLGVSGIYSEIRSKELRSQERMTLLGRGMSPAEVEETLAHATRAESKPVADPLRALANTRRSATVLLSTGVALGIFGFLLWMILQLRPVLIVSAAGVINVVIGAGFLLDYQMQKRELSRFYSGLLEDGDTDSQGRP